MIVCYEKNISKCLIMYMKNYHPSDIHWETRGVFMKNILSTFKYSTKYGLYVFRNLRILLKKEKNSFLYNSMDSKQY